MMFGSTLNPLHMMGSKGGCKVIDFCGSRVKLWKPSHVISDTTLGELDPEGTFKAMQKEWDGLTAVKAGVILSEQKKEEFCKLHGVKPITCRWVTNEKPESDEGVRARIVVKDIARGSATARSLAISSPTPSVESLRMVLGASCGIWGAELALYAIDVSQAFMNSPLRDKERIVLKMPLSISRHNIRRADFPGGTQGIERFACGESYLERVLEGNRIQGWFGLQHDRAVSLWWGD